MKVSTVTVKSPESVFGGVHRGIYEHSEHFFV